MERLAGNVKEPDILGCLEQLIGNLRLPVLPIVQTDFHDLPHHVAWLCAVRRRSTSDGLLNVSNEGLLRYIIPASKKLDGTWCGQNDTSSSALPKHSWNGRRVEKRVTSWAENRKAHYATRYDQ